MRASVCLAIALLTLPGLAEAQAEAPQTSAPTRQFNLACAPLRLNLPPASAMHVLAGYEPGRFLFGPGDALIVNAGTAQGLRSGQEYFVRRVVNDRFTPAAVYEHPVSIHTAGWVRIVDARADVSIATVTEACDGVLEGDYLEPFVSPVVPPASPVQSEPDFSHPARLVMADERRQSGASGSLMLIDQGSDQGLRAGQVLTIYRETLGGAGPIVRVGRATIMGVQPENSLVRIEATRDAVFIGDLVAIHR